MIKHFHELCGSGNHISRNKTEKALFKKKMFQMRLFLNEMWIKKKEKRSKPSLQKWRACIYSGHHKFICWLSNRTHNSTWEAQFSKENPPYIFTVSGIIYILYIYNIYLCLWFMSWLVTNDVRVIVERSTLSVMSGCSVSESYFKT